MTIKGLWLFYINAFLIISCINPISSSNASISENEKTSTRKENETNDVIPYQSKDRVINANLYEIPHIQHHYYFTAFLSKNDKIREISIKGCMFNFESINHLFSILNSNNVERLLFDECNLSLSLLNTFSSFSFSSLKNIHVVRSNLSYHGVKRLFELLPDTIEGISIVECYDNVSFSLPLTKLNLGRFLGLKSLTVSGLKYISLNLTQFFQAILSLESLEYIDFSDNAFKDTEYNLLMKHNFAAIFPQLKSINLSKNILPNDLLAHLMVCFLQCPKLECLNFANNFPPFKFYKSVDGLPKTLERFHIGWISQNFVKPVMNLDGLSYLALYPIKQLTIIGHFQKFPLELFNISNLEYLDFSVKSMPSTLYQDENWRCENLKTLKISFDFLLLFIDKIANRFPKLTQLYVKNMEYLELEILLDNLYNVQLKELSLAFSPSMCDYLSEKFKKALIHLKSLELLNVEEFVFAQFVKLLPPLKRMKVHFSVLSIINLNYFISCLSKTMNSLEMLEISFFKVTNISLGNSTACTEFSNLTHLKLTILNPTEITLAVFLLRMPKLTHINVNCVNFEFLDITVPTLLRFIKFKTTHLSSINRNRFIKMMQYAPNLIQFFFNGENFSLISSQISNSDVVYYLNCLRIFFGPLNYDICHSSFPLLLLKYNSKLREIIQQRKEATGYFNTIFPLALRKPAFLKTFFELNVEQLHMIFKSKHYNQNAIHFDNLCILLQLVDSLNFNNSNLTLDDLMIVGRIFLYVYKDFFDFEEIGVNIFDFSDLGSLLFRKSNNHFLQNFGNSVSQTLQHSQKDTLEIETSTQDCQNNFEVSSRNYNNLEIYKNVSLSLNEMLGFADSYLLVFVYALRRTEFILNEAELNEIAQSVKKFAISYAPSSIKLLIALFENVCMKFFFEASSLYIVQVDSLKSNDNNNESDKKLSHATEEMQDLRCESNVEKKSAQNDSIDTLSNSQIIHVFITFDKLFGHSIYLLLEQIMNGTLTESDRNLLHRLDSNADLSKLAEFLNSISEAEIKNIVLTIESGNVRFYFKKKSVIEKLLEVRDFESEKCPICMELLMVQEKVQFIPVDLDKDSMGCHIFHKGCLMRWLRGNKTCPMCRRKIDFDRMDKALK